MPNNELVRAYQDVQNRAKLVMHRLPGLLTPMDSEQSIASKAYALLCQFGLPNTWYYDCPALVLAGQRSCLSISGRQYKPSTEPIGGKNLISVDLSPCVDDIWGDFSRSFAFEFGTYVEHPKTREYQNGLQFQAQLHREMQAWLTPDVSFHTLYQWANLRIRQSGFVNLDFRSNVGHSLEANRESRQFIQANNHNLLSSVNFFSFEPFIRLKGGQWGFKHEDIFYFNDSKQLICL
ncbi:M24 family metallopeptidase [Undibacterium fentianense]|uniref:Aminopeptidase P family protein n=1 Tax=Undibacterium fentianense TaxID=2828728 RepID=A0A941IGR9_9BURK|nr:M24 family metallopeptidase [Undibacterium fentianense]MBR7800280.1 aminopeptidase P family protein [Undibacterium fentianense]